MPSGTSPRCAARTSRSPSPAASARADAAAQAVAHGLEDAYFHDGRKLDLYPGERVPVVLYPSEDFHDVTQTPSWTGGVYDGRIKLPSRGCRGRRPGGARPHAAPRVRPRARHISSAAAAPGLAQRGRRDLVRGGARRRARGLGATRRSPARCSSRCATWRARSPRLPADRVHVAYAQSYLAVHALVDRSGGAQPARAARRPRQRREPRRRLPRRVYARTSPASRSEFIQRADDGMKTFGPRGPVDVLDCGAPRSVTWRSRAATDDRCIRVIQARRMHSVSADRHADREPSCATWSRQRRDRHRADGVPRSLRAAGRQALRRPTSSATRCSAHGMHACDYLLACDMEMDPVPGLPLHLVGEGLRRRALRARPRHAAPRRPGWSARRWCSATSTTSRATRWSRSRRAPSSSASSSAPPPPATRRWAPRSSSSSSCARPTRRRTRRASTASRPSAGSSRTTTRCRAPRSSRWSAPSAATLDGSGVPVESSKGEWGPGQQEINLRYADVPRDGRPPRRSTSRRRRRSRSSRAAP